MLIISSLAAALITTTTAAALPVAALPPMIVTVSAAPDLSPSFVNALLAHADVVWRGTGVVFVWQRDVVRAVTTYMPQTLRVVIGHKARASEESLLPLGWIVFDDPQSPQNEIYLSYDNARTLLDRSPGVVGVVNSMPRAEIETYLSRAMGRALAHELGHYLSASKVHTAKGLMLSLIHI